MIERLKRLPESLRRLSGLEPNVFLALACLSLVLVVLPLTHFKPGMPATYKADEPAYYLAALSLVKDGDLRCEPHDLARLYPEYPYAPVRNLILSTDDGWRTVYFGKPYIFSFLASPFAAIWGANGLVAFNALLLVAMIWMTTLYLARFNPDWLAALFATGFFLMSTAWSYVYWLQPEILNTFATAACLFFGLHVYRPDDSPLARPWARLVSRRSARRLALLASSAIFAVGVYNKPMLAALGLPVAFHLLRHRRWRDLVVWLTGGALALGLIAGIALALTGHPTAYLGIDRQGFNVQTPYVMPTVEMAKKALPPPPPVEAPVASPEATGAPAAVARQAGSEPSEPAELGKETAGWWWIFQMPVLSFAEFREDLVYFFVGRHTGIFPYQPFSLIALVLFFAFARGSAVRWVVLASLAVEALFLLVMLSHNWHGGGGFVGNRYFIMAYPAFAFLVTRIRPDWLVVAGFAAGGLLLGPLLLAPFGLLMPSPTLQAHARSQPFQAFPLEHSLRELPGHWGVSSEGVYFFGRKDQIRPADEEIWITAGEEVDVWLSSLEPLTELAFEVRSPLPGNAVTIEIEDAREELVAGEEPSVVKLAPAGPGRMRKDRHRADWENLRDVYVYRMKVRFTTGEMPRWRGKGKQHFYRGGMLRYLGAGAGSPAP